MKCSSFTTAPVCYNDGATNRTLIAHYEYATDSVGAAILYRTRYTEADGTVVDTSAGTVVAGACALIPPDVEFESLCDVQTDGSIVEFFRRSITTFDSVGDATVTVTDWELDKVTAYVPAGDVVACNADCDPVIAQGVSTSWG